MLRKIISLTLSLSLLFQYSGFAQGSAQLNLAQYLSQMPRAGSDKFRPLHMRYFSYDPQNNDFDLLLDKGDEKGLKDDELKEKTAKLLEYFKIGLALPNDKFWVNLRPDAPDEIIDPDLEKTDIGRILLEADLQLKKDTAAWTSPQNPEGKAYWDKLYNKAGELFGTENITIPTVTRPWIVPGEVIINTSASAAYIYKANLKVMLEEDYLSQRTEEPKDQRIESFSFSDPRLKELNEYSTQLIKELIIPKLTKEINTAKRYSALRQVFYSLVLAKWFKKTFAGKSGEYSSLIDSNNLTGLTSQESWSKLSYFNEYKKSFQDGEYNLKEPVYSPVGQALRSYVSGGALPMDGNPIELNGNISLPTGKNIIPVSLSKGKIAASAIVDKQGAFDLVKKWFNKIFPLHPEGFGNIVLDEDKHYKGTPRYGEGEMAVMKKEISAFIKRQYGDSPDNFKEPVYVFAIGIGGQSACVLPAVKHMRRQPNRILIECDSLGIDYSGYENELVAAIRKNPKTKVLWEVGSKSGKTDETMTNFQQVFQMLIRVWSRVEYGDDAGRIIAQELIDKLFDGLPLAEKRPEQLNLKSEEQKILGLVFDGLFMVTGKYDETQKKGSRLDQFRKGFLRQFYQGEDKVASLEMLDNLGGRYQMIGPNTAVLAALFGLNVDDIFAGGKQELLAQRSGDSRSIAIAESLYQADAHHLLIAFPSGIIFSALGEGFDQNIAESTGKGRGIGEPVGLQPYVYTPDTIKDAFSNVKLTGKKAYFIIDVPGLPRIDIEKHKKEGDIVFRYQMNEISEKEFGRLVQFVEGITVRYGTLNTAQILNKKQGEYNLTDIDLSDPEVMRQIMRGPDKTNPAKEGLQKLNDIWKQIDIFLQPDVEEAKNLLAKIARLFLNNEGKTDKGLPVRDKEARKDFYNNISKELNFSGGIIVSRGGLGLINQDGRYVSGDEAAGSLNYLISGIKEGTPLKEGTPSLRLGFIKEHTLSYLKQLYSSSIKDSGYPDTSLNNIQHFEMDRIRWFKDLHEQLSGKRLSAAQEDTARALAALLLKAHKSGKTLNFTLYEVKDGVTEILRDFMRHLGIDCVDFGPGVQHKRFQLAAGGNGDTLAMEVIVQSVKEPDYSNIEKEIIKADGNVPDYLHGLLPQEERWLYGKAYSQRFKDVKTETAELLVNDLSDETNMLNFMAVLVRMKEICTENIGASSAVINKSKQELKSLIQESQSRIKAAIMDLKVKNIISVEDEDLKEYRIVDGLPLNIALSDGEKITIDNYKLSIIKEKILPAVLKEYDLRGPDYNLLEELAKEDSDFSRDLARFLDEERNKDAKKYDGNKAKSWTKEALVLLGIALAQTGFESHHGLERLNPGDVFIMAGDNGPSTPVIRHYLAEGLRLAGIMVIDLGLCSSGELYTSIERFGVQGGLYVTRSHVELGTNGFKPKIGKTTLFAEMITQLGQTIKANKFNLLPKGVITDQAKVDTIKRSTRQLYLAHIALEFGRRLKELLQKFPDSKLAVDCGNGSSTEYVDFLKEMLGDNLVKVFRDKPDPFCKSGLADASRSDEVALGHPKSAGDKSIVRWSKDNPDVLIFNFDLDMDRCSIMKDGILYKGEKVFYPLVEYGLAVESNEIKQKEYLSDLRMSPAFVEMAKHFGGKAVIYPKGHSKIKEEVGKTLSVLAKENHAASIKEFINKSGYKNRQAEFSLHMFYVNEQGACVDDALHFMFEWLTAFGAVIGRKKSDFDYSGYIANLEKEGVISKWYTIEEQRTPMQDEYKKKLMNDLRDYIRDRFHGRSDFEYLSYNDLRKLGGVMVKKFTLVDVDGVYGFFTPLGIFYWGWSNTSEKIAFGAHSRDRADIKNLVEIMMACFYELRDKLPNLRDDSKKIGDGETRDYLNIMGAKTNPEAQNLVMEKYNSAEKAIAELATTSSAAEQVNDFKGGGIDMKGDGWIQVVGMNNIREFSDVLPGNINRELDIDKELKEIRNLIQGGNVPSPERLGEDIGYCLYKDHFGAHREDIELSLMGVGRLKEEYGLDMGKEYLRILFLVNSINSPFEPESYVSED